MSNYRRVFIQNSFVFLTIISYNRRPILIQNIELLRNAFKESKEHYNYEIVACVIMPEHMHLILKTQNIKDYPQIISNIKHNFSKRLNIIPEDLSDSKIKKREKGVWHRRYFEHTIVDEMDLSKHIDYIHYNPVKHGVVLNVRDWKYSSFHNFVKKNLYQENWGCENMKDFCNLYAD